MTVAIVHYHLRPGGVTRVIESASRALLAEGVRHVILSGSAAPAGSDLPVRVVEGLDYLREAPSVPPEILENRLRAAAWEILGGPPHIWHFHNPTLGKYSAFTDLIARLARAGECLALQIHDLAEDGRPQNHTLLAERKEVYPIGTSIRYLFLNERDRGRFIDAGIPEEIAHYLPNPVCPSPPEQSAGSASHPTLVFYPVRGIRRKNLGELVLLSAHSPPGARFAVASAPDNPRWKDIYDSWREFADHNFFPVDFEVVGRVSPAPGADSSFSSWLGAATHLATTSTAEGFGYVFLDSIARRKPLIGRSIPYLTSDHSRQDIQFPGLYDKLIVPSDWIDGLELRKQLVDGLTEIHRLFGKALAETTADSTWQSFKQGGFDFANLPENVQRNCIVRSLTEPSNRILVVAGGREQILADWLDDVLTHPPAVPDISLIEQFGETVNASRIVGIYQGFPAKPGVISWLGRDRILDRYLRPEHFQFLSIP